MFGITHTTLFHARLGPHRMRRAVRRTVVTALLAVLWPVAAWGQSFFGENPEVPKDLAKLRVHLEPRTARPGEHVRVVVTARIKQGWYTYSLVPQGELAPPPTRLAVEPGPLTSEGPAYETNPHVKTDKVFGIPLATHPDAARFYQNLAVPEDISAESAAVAARLTYQVCNSKLCTPPRTETLNARLDIEDGPVRPAFGYMNRTVDYVGPDGSISSGGDSLEQALSGGVWAFLVLAAGFGLLALLTPCVFPMIPVTVSFFAGAHRSGGGVRLAVLFALGIVVTYTGIGLALSLLLGATGVSQFATSPWTNLAVAGFFTVFALSLMGVYDAALPASWVQGVDAASRRMKNGVGVLLMGTAFTATAFTCTMPFVGTLLLAATQGHVLWPLLGMLVFSAVFAAPFFLLALFPRFALAVRGKGGNWLVQLKVVLGLVELGAALKFLSNADVIWRWGVVDRGMLLLAWGALAAIVALLLLGWLPWPGVTVKRRGLPRWAVSGAFVALAAYLALGVAGTELDSLTEAYVPPPLEQPAPGGRARVTAAALGPDDRVDEAAVHDLAWHPTLGPALAEAKRTGKPVFIDFTGYTCVNCRWMEKKIFVAKPVYEAFSERFTLARLYTDGGPHADENQSLQVERFRTIALPYYVILSPDNTVLARHAGIVPSPDDFLAFLEQGLKQQEQVAADADATAARSR